MNTLTRTFGSGAVKITGAHDFNDYAVARRGGIPMLPVDGSARQQMRDDGAALCRGLGRNRT